jgi:hypothetical protein
MIGQSMGGYGAFRYGLKYKDKFCAFAANGAEINFHLFIDNIHTKLLTENSGPPYSYSYQGGGPFTKWMFLFAGAAAPNLNTPQTYINPAIVEYPFNEYCEPIDTVWQKIHARDILPLLHNTLPEDSVGILYCCGTNDEWQLYESNAALADTLDALGLPYEFYSHTGGHGMPQLFRQRALIFLDSLLLSPTTLTGLHAPANRESQISLGSFPNPFKHRTTIFYELLQTEYARLSVHNQLGQEIMVLYEGKLQQGQYQIELDAASLPPGIYFLRLQAAAASTTRKIIKY